MSEAKSEMPAMYVIFVLDESGSMASQRSETISGVNEYVQQLRKDHPGEKILFSLIKFQTEVSPVHLAVPLEDVKEMTNDDYCPRTMTALYDGVGHAINELSKRIDDSEECDVVVVIMTDGHENSSKEFNYTQICSLIEEKKKKEWSFVFMGADESAWKVGNSLGVQSSVQYNAGDMGQTMAAVATSNTAYRTAKRSQHVNSVDAAKVFADTFDNIVKPKVPDIDMDKWEGIDDVSPTKAKNEKD